MRSMQYSAYYNNSVTAGGGVSLRLCEAPGRHSIQPALLQ